MEDRSTVKEYTDLLKENDMEDMMRSVLLVLRVMDRLKNSLDMASSDLRHIKKGISTLAFETGGKDYMEQAFYAALEEVAMANEYYGITEAIVVKGIADSMAWFRAGHKNGLEKPYPIQAVERRLESIKKCLHDAFVEVDLGIGRTEEAEGMFSYYGQYCWKGSGEPWVESGGDPALLDTLWLMHSLRMGIKDAYELAHQTALRTDDFRPKGHAKIVYSPLQFGYYWEKEKTAILEKQRESEQSEKQSWKERTEEPIKDEDVSLIVQGNQDDKISLHKRLKVAEEKSRYQRSKKTTTEKGKKAIETQR